MASSRQGLLRLHEKRLLDELWNFTRLARTFFPSQYTLGIFGIKAANGGITKRFHVHETQKFVSWLMKAAAVSSDVFHTFCFSLLYYGHFALFNLLLDGIDPEHLRKTASKYGDIRLCDHTDDEADALVDMVDVDTSQPMTEFRKSLLQEHRDYIADQLSAIDQVVVFFAYSGLIYKGLAESVTMSHIDERVHNFLDLLTTLPNDAYDLFCFALLLTRHFNIYIRLQKLTNSIKLEHMDLTLRMFTNRRNRSADSTASQSNGDECSAQAVSDDELEPSIMDITVEQPEVHTARELPYYNDPETVYRNFTRPKGLALVINNHLFKNVKWRAGTEVDARNITALLEELGYLVTVKENQLAKKMELIASKFARDKRHADCDSCVVVVLTHGDDGHLIGMDEEHVDIHDFVERFNARLAPGLAGKPKIFIFQACRGDKRDYGTEEVVVNWTREDMRRLSATQRLEQQQWATSSSSAYQTLKTNPIQIGYGLMASDLDVLVAYSTIPKYVSYRNQTLGSRFVQAICEIFPQYAATECIESMLKRVHSRVAKMSNNNEFMQTPEYTSRLTKKFYFFPGIYAE